MILSILMMIGISIHRSTDFLMLFLTSIILQLDPETTTALNCSQPQDALGIFKVCHSLFIYHFLTSTPQPSALRNDPNPTIYSDADEEILVIAKFISPVHIRKLCIIGGNENTEHHPNQVRLYVNRDGIDFTEVHETRPTQVFDLPINIDGTVELIPSVHAFTGVNSLAFFFPSNYGADATAIQYIGMQGEHTHFRREAVNTVYEVLCTGDETVHGHADALLGKEHSH